MRSGEWRRRGGVRPGSDVTAVVGAVGGVGASTLAALLARQRAIDGGGATLVDLHLGRGGIEVLLGIERESGVRWPDLSGVRGTLAQADLDGLLPRWRGVEVLSATGRGGDVDPTAVAAVVRGLVGSGRPVIVDLPAGVGPSGWVLPELVGSVDLVLVTGQDVLGVAGAAAVRDVVVGDARLVLRRRAAARVAPGEEARALGLPLAGLLPTDRGVAGATDRGLGPTVPSWSPLARAVRRIGRGTR